MFRLLNKLAINTSVTRLLLPLLCFSTCMAKANNVEDKQVVEEIIVTATQHKSLLEMPRSVSVIDQLDIQASGANNLQAILRSQANISLTSFSGNGKFSRIDIRGSGDTSGSNVLMLVDGVRINTPDLTGAEFSIVPLSQIDRVEVVRGANAVRFGDGASQGVINIITKANQAQSQLSASTALRSFNGLEHSFSASIGEKHQFSIAYDNRRSDGYREHNRFKADTTLFSYQYKPQQTFSTKLIALLHQHDYQLSGPLAYESLVNNTVEASDSDENLRSLGDNHDQSVSLINRWSPNENLYFTSVAHYRERKNDFFSSLTANEDSAQLRTLNLDLNSHLRSPRYALSLIHGIHYRKSTYQRSDGGINQTGRILNQGELEGFASFININSEINDKLTLEAGSRIDITPIQFYRQQLTAISDTSSPDCVLDPTFNILVNCPDRLVDNELNARDKRWKNSAWEASALYHINPQFTFYSSAAKTFRNPNIDELAVSPDELKPQRANRYEMGLKYQGNKNYMSIGLFKSKTIDEILFRGAQGTGENFNAEPINRQGIEVSLGLQANDWLKLTYNGGYTHARDDQLLRIPHIVEKNHTLTANLRSASWQFDINTIYVGERLDGNDENNQLFSQENYVIPSFTLTNLRLAFNLLSRDAMFTFFCGVNNVFDKQHLTASYSKTVYPGDGRELYSGISFEL